MTEGAASGSRDDTTPDTTTGDLDVTEVPIAAGWDVHGVTNGGYVLATVADALRQHVGRPDPLAVSAHYLAPCRAGTLLLTPHPGRQGRRHATVAATGHQSGQSVVQVTATFTDLAESALGSDRIETTAPSLPAPEDCAPRRGFAQEGLGRRVDLRLHPEDAAFGDGRPSGHSRTRGWVRLADGRPPDGLTLLLFADVFPPAAFNTGLPVGWVPTVQLTVHVRARPSPGWIRAAFTTRAIAGGYLEEDGELWDDRGQLVAQSRQLAVASRPSDDARSQP
jgi:acyl-CoA thioesterase